MLEYHAAYYLIEDGWYMAKVLDFPGVVTQGKNLDHARRMLRDALREMGLVADGRGRIAAFAEFESQGPSRQRA